MSDYAVRVDTSADVPAFAKTMASALASGREFAVWIESDAGDERLAYSIRREAGAYRVRDSDLSDVGVYAEVETALRQGQRLVDDRL